MTKIIVEHRIKNITKDVNLRNGYIGKLTGVKIYRPYQPLFINKGKKFWDIKPPKNYDKRNINY